MIEDDTQQRLNAIARAALGDPQDEQRQQAAAWSTLWQVLAPLGGEVVPNETGTERALRVVEGLCRLASTPGSAEYHALRTYYSTSQALGAAAVAGKSEAAAQAELEAFSVAEAGMEPFAQRADITTADPVRNLTERLARVAQGFDANMVWNACMLLYVSVLSGVNASAQTHTNCADFLRSMAERIDAGEYYSQEQDNVH